MRILKTILYLLPVFLMLHACSVRKYIPEGEFLYRGSEVVLSDSVQVDKKSVLKSELEDVFYPQPNTKFLGGYPGLYYHYKAQKENSGWFSRTLNRWMGEKPVYLSDVDSVGTENILLNRMENNGFYYGNVDFKIEKRLRGKTARIHYFVHADRPYILKSYVFEPDSTGSDALNKQIKNALSETVLNNGSRFNLSALKAERERIDSYLKNRGYYYFNKDFLLFEADTNQLKNRDFELYLKLKDGVPKKSKVPYAVREIEVYADGIEKSDKQDKFNKKVKGISFYQEEKFFKPERLRPFIMLNPDDLYNPDASRITGRRLSSLGIYKYVNIQYKEIDSIDPNSEVRGLKSIITLSPLSKRSFQFHVEGVSKSNNFTGPGLGFGYTNRNIFRGGENWSIEGNFGYEKQFGKDSDGGSSLRLGLKTSLLFPRMLFPGNYDDSFTYSIPKTKISLGTDFLNRSGLYSLHSFSGAFGYIWEQNRFVTHRLNPLNIDYVKLGNTSHRFKDILNQNPFLQRSFEQQFIAGLTYSFIYNELLETHQRSRLYFRFNFDIAGNSLSLFAKENNQGSKSFLGLRYAQYVKADIDLSYHQHLGKPNSDNILVGHIFAGIGVPYGNSKTMPYVKQYFAGGPYSVRAFRTGGLGPGVYNPEGSSFSYFDRSGDIRLEANLEYRFPIFSFFKGALFADAGNTWLLNENETMPGSRFHKKFFNDMGVGAGFGLCVDIQGFVVRFDLASPAKRPGKKWDFEYKRPVFNFAIGYPF